MGYRFDCRILYNAVSGTVCFELCSETFVRQYFIFNRRSDRHVDYFNADLFKDRKESQKKRTESFGSFSGIYFRHYPRNSNSGADLFYDDDAGAEVSGTAAKKSKAFPYLERVTESVKGRLPESLFDNPVKKEQEPDEIEELIEKLNTSSQKEDQAKKQKKPEPEKPVDPEKADDLFNALNNPQVEEKTSARPAQGYNKQEREELDKLFLESMEEAESVVD